MSVHSHKSVPIHIWTWMLLRCKTTTTKVDFGDQYKADYDEKDQVAYGEQCKVYYNEECRVDYDEQY